MLNLDFAIIVNFTDVVVTSIDVFCARMLDVVFDMYEGGVGVCLD
jgi:hypothetical protein